MRNIEVIKYMKCNSIEKKGETRRELLFTSL